MLTSEIINTSEKNLGQTLLESDAWAIVSPHINGGTPRENELNARLLKDQFCDSDRYPLIGCWEGELESSYLILDPRFVIFGFRELFRLNFKQSAIITRDGLLTEDGETPITGVDIIRSRTDGPTKLVDLETDCWTCFGGDFFTFKF